MESNNIKEISYSGKQINDILEFPNFVSCLGLSYSHDVIFWFQNLEEIHIQGLHNNSLQYHHTLSGKHVVDIIYSKNRLYWAQKAPMGIYYYKRWNEPLSQEYTVRNYTSNNIIQDFAVVDTSNQPYYPGMYKTFTHTHTHTHTRIYIHTSYAFNWH